MLANHLKRVPKCEKCVFHVKGVDDVSRCKLFTGIDQLSKEKNYVEVEVARFDDFALCGNQGRYYQPKKVK